MLTLLRRVLRRKPVRPHAGPQGEDYEAVQMERQWEAQRGRFAENLIKKVGHKNLPFLDDPYN